MRLILFLLLLTFLQTSLAQERMSTFDTANTVNTAGREIWILTYFRQRYPTRIEIDKDGKTIEVPLPDPMLDAKLHIALSNDGRHWMRLNNNQPIWNQMMRDPFIHRGSDGIWRLVATGGSGVKEDREQFGPSCLYATSRDLVHWKVEAYLHLMKDVRDDSGALVRNIWAPEFFYDESAKEYVLFWSSTFKDAGWKESRLWYCKTRDWKTFSTAKALFSPPYSVIDGTLVKHADTYYLFHKEEMFGAQYGERRAIRLATSKNLEGPYQVQNGPLNNGQLVPTITEGPSVMPDPVNPGWLLLYDYPMADRFGISSSPDLVNWSIEKDVSLPADARHGSVSRLTEAEAKTLLIMFPNKKR